MKTVFTQSNNTEIKRIADYPCDDYWSPLNSCPPQIQPQINVLIAKRERDKASIHLKISKNCKTKCSFYKAVHDFKVY